MPEFRNCQEASETKLEDCVREGETHQEVCTGAGDEAQSVIAWLHVLPEVHVGVVEDVGVHVEVVETLGRQDHADIVPAIKVW